MSQPYVTKFSCISMDSFVSADRYSLFLVSEDSSNDKFLISHLFDVAGGSTLEEASNNCICLEWNKGIVGHVTALGLPLNIKDAYEKRKKKNSFLLFPFHYNTAFPAQAPNSLQDQKHGYTTKTSLHFRLF
nr:cGMP-specific 3',5'-cyclic phosphodiesterase-like [Odocoileus virginianus texanus]